MNWDYIKEREHRMILGITVERDWNYVRLVATIQIISFYTLKLYQADIF